MNLKKNASLIIGLSVPVLMVLLVAASVYLPAAFAKPPQYNFVYTIDDGYSSNGLSYSVSNGKIVQEGSAPSKTPLLNVAPGSPVPVVTSSRPQPKLYLYDVHTNTTRELTLAEAQTFHINESQTSPDGYQVQRATYSGGFPFDFGAGVDYNAQYLEGHNMSTKLNLNLSSRYAYGSFRFLGWVIP